MSFAWTCPFCGRDATITSSDTRSSVIDFGIRNADDLGRLKSELIVCPNSKCNQASLAITLMSENMNAFLERVDGEILNQWQLIPASRAQSFPNYVPEAIRKDYEEACLIQNLSPKASATLSRRCMQGILRDFWKVKPGRLVDEIAQIQTRTDPLVWDAIDSVRKVGNIGAHMEKDIDLIVDVDTHEAELLIELIEILLKETYISREHRQNQLSSIKALADQKDTERKLDSLNP